MSTAQAIAKAKKTARERGEVMAVIEIDGMGERRVTRVVANEYTYSAEYDAFGGFLVAEVHPCGDVQGQR